jgi:hypothetical protein
MIFFVGGFIVQQATVMDQVMYPMNPLIFF